MVRHHVPHGPYLVVEAPTLLYAQVLGNRYLNIVNITAVPNGLEDAIRKTKGHDVLYRLFTQIVVDAVHLMLFQNFTDLQIERASGLKIMSEGFLDDDPPPAAILLTRESSGPKLFDDLRKKDRGSG